MRFATMVAGDFNFCAPGETRMLGSCPSAIAGPGRPLGLGLLASLLGDMVELQQRLPTHYGAA
eukprot:5712787-Heterocapsa_arctica.AAC.1